MPARVALVLLSCIPHPWALLLLCVSHCIRQPGLSYAHCQTVPALGEWNSSLSHHGSAGDTLLEYSGASFLARGGEGLVEVQSVTSVLPL